MRFPVPPYLLLAGLWTLAACATPAAAQPWWLSGGRPTPHNLRTVFAVDSLHAWTGGDSGVILSTNDAGGSWTLQRGADSVSVRDLFMIDTLRGWAAAIRPLVNPGDWNGSILYRTTDGGAIWTEQQYPGQFFNTLFFFDSLDGWLGGESGLILGTTDGGLSWSAPAIQSTVYSTFPVSRIRFHSPDLGYAVGGYPESAGVIWRTVDGGANWSVSGIGDALRAIHFVDSLNLFFAGGGFDDGACVTRTTNGGATWSFSYVGPFGFGTSMAFRDAAEGWVPLGFAGTSMVTRDTGATWTEVQNAGGIPTYGVSFAGDRRGYMVGDSGSVFVYNNPVEVAVLPQWNIVSLPVETGTGLKDSLFPGATSPAYRYTPGGYVAEETLKTGRGYWLKFPSDGVFGFQGVPRTSDTIAVAAGWNMIGALPVPVGTSSVTTDPPGMLLSGFYEFGNGYAQAATLAPGKGYWVKVSGEGTIILDAGPE